MISELRNHRCTGTWETADGKIKLLWTRELGEKGVGQGFDCGSVCQYKSYTRYKRAIRRYESLSIKEITTSADWKVSGWKGRCLD